MYTRMLFHTPQFFSRNSLMNLGWSNTRAALSDIAIIEDISEQYIGNRPTERNISRILITYSAVISPGNKETRHL
jgi:hypothetical protein